MKQMMKPQKGFTLIELMIVITIIGILASIAVPAYQDYTIRTRVGECATIYSTLKTETTIFYSETGNLPNTIASLAAAGRVSTLAGAYSGDYVSDVSIVGTGQSGRITCTLQTATELGDASGNIAVFEPVTDAAGVVLNWNVSQGLSTVPNKYLPSLN